MNFADSKRTPPTTGRSQPMQLPVSCRELWRSRGRESRARNKSRPHPDPLPKGEGRSTVTVHSRVIGFISRTNAFRADVGKVDLRFQRTVPGSNSPAGFQKN